MGLVDGSVWLPYSSFLQNPEHLQEGCPHKEVKEERWVYLLAL